MGALFLLVTTAITFCALGGVLLWKGRQHAKRPRARRPGASRAASLSASALQFLTAALSRGARSRAGDDDWQIRWGDQRTPDIELSRAESLRQRGLCEVPIRLGVKESITDFILSVTQVFGADGASPTLKLVFSPALAAQLRNGQLDVIRRTIGTKPLAFDPNSGKIREIQGIAAAVNASAAIAIAWEVDTYLTARRFSQDLGKSLRFIAAHIAEIRQTLFEEYDSEMNADYHYLLQVSVSAELGNLSPEDAAVAAKQLETVEERIGAIFSTAQRQLERRVVDLKQSHDPEMWKPEDLAGAVRFEISYFTELSWLALLALQMQSAAIYVRIALPLSKDGTAGRLRELSNDFTRFAGAQRWFFERIGASVSNIELCARQHETDDVSTARVRAYSKEAEENLSTASREVEGVLASLQSAVNAGAGSAPVEVFAKIDGAEVTLLAEGTA